jgi:hypothetical protein
VKQHKLKSVETSAGWRSIEQCHQLCLLLLDLIDGALPWRLIRAPAQQPGAMSEALAGEMVVADLDHELRFERHPLGRTFGGPAARPAGRIPGEAGRAGQRFQSFRQRGLVLTSDRRGESDVIEPPLTVIETQQQRAD